ncbi:MAG: hypothetical protein SGILL_002475, partial [Bacillariaceae sp.]
EASCNTSGDEDSEAEEDEDDFDLNGISEPRLSSSTVPIVVEVSNAHKTARFYKNEDDPLFQGVCLYSTSTTSAKSNKNSQSSSNITSEDYPASPEKLSQPRTDAATPSDKPESLGLWDQWYIPSVFRYLWHRGSTGNSWQSKRRIQMDSE